MVTKTHQYYYIQFHKLLLLPLFLNRKFSVHNTERTKFLNNKIRIYKLNNKGRTPYIFTVMIIDHNSIILIIYISNYIFNNKNKFKIYHTVYSLTAIMIHDKIQRYSFFCFLELLKIF